MIHVIGNAAIDSIYRVDRFPLPGETIVARELSEDLGGKGANQAIIAARAGANVRLIAAIGNDAAGSCIREALEAEGVLTDGLSVWNGSTDRSSIYVDAGGENTIVSVTNAAVAFDPLAAGALAHLKSGDFVLCQGNLSIANLAACLAAAKDRGAVTILNPSPLVHSGDLDWTTVEVAVLNRVEAEQLSSSHDRRHGAQTLLDAGARSVVVTLGRNGAMMIGSERIEIEAPRVAATDTTGAGDVFCGTLTAARAQGAPWRAALAAAVETAAITVTRPGVFSAFPTAKEVRAILSRELEG